MAESAVNKRLKELEKRVAILEDWRKNGILMNGFDMYKYEEERKRHMEKLGWL